MSDEKFEEALRFLMCKIKKDIKKEFGIDLDSGHDSKKDKKLIFKNGSVITFKKFDKDQEILSDFEVSLS